MLGRNGKVQLSSQTRCLIVRAVLLLGLDLIVRLRRPPKAEPVLATAQNARVRVASVQQLGIARGEEPSSANVQGLWQVLVHF